MLEEVERWLSTRSWSAADRPLDRLLAAEASAAAGTVSVVLPALNEEATVGDDRRGDPARADASRSRWSTSWWWSTPAPPTVRPRSPRRPGARVVHRDDDPARGCPAVPGKGEVLWRSLLVTSGDIVCFVDADLREFSSDFVSGIVGPLLTDPDVRARQGDVRPAAAATTAGQGGRVTELVARPLLNLHWPQLAGFVQPLGGEYAARRSLLERLPFPVGYGVELGLLVDALHTVGPGRARPGRRRRAQAPPPGRAGAGPDGRGDLPHGAAAAGPRASWSGPSLTQFERGAGRGFEPRTYVGGHGGAAADARDRGVRGAVGGVSATAVPGRRRSGTPDGR